MRVKSILNQVEKNKPFVCERVRWAEDEKALLMEMGARPRSRPVCSGCGEAGPGHDTLPARRRVQCRRCGVKVERIPWAEGKQTLTRYGAGMAEPSRIDGVSP